LDPALVYDTESYTAVFNIFDRLVQYKQGTLEIEPSLATSWETPDPLTYIFNLRQDVFFHDSTPFNAESVKFSFDRAIEMDLGTAYIFYAIDTIEVLDIYKVKFTLSEEFSPFLQVLAHPAASIVSPTAAEAMGTAEGEGFDINPVGTGPFKFDHWTKGKELVLKANKQYFRGPPILETVVFKVMLESSERLLQITNGGIDADLGSTGITLADFASLEGNPDVRVHKRPGLSVEFIALNLEKPPLNDTRVREAIAYALDYDAIIEEGMAGGAERIGGPVAPGIFGFADLPLRQQDIEKAKQLLGEAGFPNGFHITLTYNIDNLNRRKTAEVIKTSLSAIGVDVTLEGLDWDSVVDKYNTLSHEMGLDLWVPDYFDADSYLTPLYHSASLVPNGFNEFAFSDPKVDELLDQARTETSPDARLSMYREAQERIVSQVPSILLCVPTHYDLMRFDIANFVQSPTGLFYAYDLYRR
jgi:peptide/nickel transport system substrate-binding protein